MNERETIRCQHCDLNQFRTENGLCRRCRKELSQGTIEITRIVYRPSPKEPAAVIPMRQVMQAAAVHAIQYIGHTTKAAKALQIPHGRLKQLLREAGEDYGRDRRNDPRKQK